MKYYDFSSIKRILRKKLKAQLKLLDSLEKSDSSKTIIVSLAKQEVFAEGKPLSVLLYSAMGLEANVSGIIHHYPMLRFVLPRVIPGTTVLECRTFRSESDLAPGSFGILEPNPECCALVEPGELDIAIIPGCAFSASGQRLGQGGGYYDRFLARPDFRAYTIGVCFECQFFDQLPTEAHDRPVDCVITEDGVRWKR